MNSRTFKWIFAHARTRQSKGPKTKPLLENFSESLFAKSDDDDDDDDAASFSASALTYRASVFLATKDHEYVLRICEPMDSRSS